MCYTLTIVFLDLRKEIGVSALLDMILQLFCLIAGFVLLIKGADIFVEGEPRSYDCGTAVFCGGQREEAVAVWRVEHVVLYLGILDYPLLFCGAQSSGMGHKELASHSFL